MKIYILLVLFMMLILTSCEKIKLQEADSNVPVIESYISPGNSVSVKVIKQLVYNSSDTTNQILEELEILLSDASTIYTLNYLGDGIYKNPEINIQASVEYNIQFNYNNKTVYAETVVPERPANFATSANSIEAFSFGGFQPGMGSMPTRPDPITLSWSNPDLNYHMIVVENIEVDPVLINEESDRPSRSFRNAPTQANSQELNPMSFLYYGKHRIILYSLNAEYAALYEQLSTSSLDITAPPSNIENGLGIFTGINSDTLLVTVIEQQ